MNKLMKGLRIRKQNVCALGLSATLEFCDLILMIFANSNLIE